MNPVFNLTTIELQQVMFGVFALEYKDYDDFVKRYGTLLTETLATMAITTMANYLEAVGYLLK